MNIKFKRFLRMALCLLLCAVFFTGGVFAAGKLQKRTITVYSGVDIYVDDARLDARDANGNPVEVFIYNGTTYLPVRAVGEAVGKAVQWVVARIEVVQFIQPDGGLVALMLADID